MLNKDQLNEFLDSFDYVAKKTEALLEKLSSFKDTDIKIKEEINNLKSLLSQFQRFEDKLKNDVSFIVRGEIKKFLKENEKELNQQIQAVNYLLKKLNSIESNKSCIWYFVSGFLTGLVPIILIYFIFLKI